MVDSAGKLHERCGYEDAIYERQRSLGLLWPSVLPAARSAFGLLARSGRIAVILSWKTLELTIADELQREHESFGCGGLLEQHLVNRCQRRDATRRHQHL